MPSPNYRDNEAAKFRDVPSGIAVAVTIDQAGGAPVPVFITEEGEGLSEFNEVSSVASGSIVDLISYTVPVGETLKLSFASVSGENYAEYTVEVDGSIIDKKRTWWGGFDAVFQMGGFEIQEGSVLKVRVNNFRNSVADFNARISGILK